MILPKPLRESMKKYAVELYERSKPMTKENYLHKTGKLYTPQGTHRVRVAHYNYTWDEYYCEFLDGGHSTVGTSVPARDMVSRFVEDSKDIDRTCTCGAAKCKQPSHSTWCDSVNNENRRR